MKGVRSSFRLDQLTIALIDRLGDRLGGLDRTSILRLAVRRLADVELNGDIEKWIAQQNSEACLDKRQTDATIVVSDQRSD